MDGVWVPPGTMERTSPSYHPSLSESFIAARCTYIHKRIYECYTQYIHTHIYVYIYILYICLRSAKNASLSVPVYFTHSLQLSNQDLSLLPIVTDATRARTPVYLTCSGWCQYHLCGSCRFAHTYEHVFFLYEFNCLINLQKSSFYKPKYVYQ